MRSSIFKAPLAKVLLLVAPLPLLGDDCCNDGWEEVPCDFECFTSSYLSPETLFIIAGDYLYWYANEKGLPYAMEATAKNIGDENLPQIAYAPDAYIDLDESWNPGYRIMGSLTPMSDGWDFTAIWTSYSTTNHNKTSVPPTVGILPEVPGDQILYNPWMCASSINDDGVPPSFDTIQANWNLRFHMIDGELGRKYWLSRWFSLRPFIGMRAAWIKTTFNTTSTKEWTTSPSLLQTLNYQDKFTNKAEGIGLLGGIQPNFHFTPNFSLFANLSTSLLWGKAKTVKTQDYLEEIGGIPSRDIHSTSNGEFYQIFSALDLGVGFRWETCFCGDRFRWAIDLGWENHYWFDTFYRNKTLGSFYTIPSPTLNGFTSYDRIVTDLILAGGFGRLRFDF